MVSGYQSLTSGPFIALTDKAWFDFLSAAAENHRLDEVNFWSPRSLRPLKLFAPGEPVFFRLKDPFLAIAGYGFFAHFATLDLREAWNTFEQKNGDPDLPSFFGRIGKFRGIDLLDPRTPKAPIGCTILRDATFWPPSRWIPWGDERGWPKNVVRGKTQDGPVSARLLLDEIAKDEVRPPEDLGEVFHLLDVNEREIAFARSRIRVGQGTFRARLLDAYGRRCAVTRERTEPVLDAAHIQPYLGPRSNHPQNGLLLTKEFHTLFDLGYVTVEPDLRVRVSKRLRDGWENGKRYYPYDGAEAAVPDDPREAPSRSALEWHRERVFLA